MLYSNCTKNTNTVILEDCKIFRLPVRQLERKDTG